MPSLRKIASIAPLGFMDVRSTAEIVTGSWGIADARDESLSGATLDNGYNDASYTELSFNGDVIGVAYKRGEDIEIFELYVDGVLKATIDGYGVEKWNTITWIRGLSEGAHTLRIKKTGTKNAGSYGFYVRLEGFVVRADSNLTQPSPKLTHQDLEKMLGTGLDGSQARTASGTGGVYTTLGRGTKTVMEVNVTAVSGTSPTLDIYVQTSHNGETFMDASFLNTSTPLKFPQITAVGSYSLQFEYYGLYLRLRWDIGGTTPSFTFSTSIILRKSL